MDEKIRDYASSNISHTINENEVNILHLSDLHFGIEKHRTVTGKRQRFRQRELFKKLIDTLKDDASVPLNWKPDVVIISGDIAWSGDAEEYQEFYEEFLTPLMQVLNLNDKRIITSPGNHDIIRDNAEGFERPHSGIRKLQAKNITRESIDKRRKFHFEGYVGAFCDGDPQKLCQSVTLPEWPWVRFLVMNSAWDCRDDADEGTLRVGLDLLEEITGENKEGEIIVSVFHHPHTEVEDFDINTGNRKKRNWLHVSEREPEQEGGICFSNFLERHSDFILNGHIHKETVPRHSQEAKSIQLISGAAYSTDTPKYHCRILKLRRGDESQYRDIRCTLGGGDCIWEVTSPKDFRVFGLIQTNTRKKAEAQEEEKELFAEAQVIFNSEDSPQHVEEMKAVLQKMMQYFARSSGIEDNYELDDDLHKDKDHVLEAGTSFLLKGPR